MVMVEGCLTDATWCKVTHGEVVGWSAGDYLTATVEDAPVVLWALDKRVVVKPVTYDHEAEATAAGLATDAIAVALTAGPAVGGVPGVATGSALAPDPLVISYVSH